jgi:hypothetical protein
MEPGYLITARTGRAVAKVARGETQMAADVPQMNAEKFNVHIKLRRR